VRDAIADILDNMTLEQFVAKDGKLAGGDEDEVLPVSAAS
jgi:hypothetical protein